MKYILIHVFFLLSIMAAAQETVNYQQQYLNAKALFNEGRYALARAQFEKLTARAPGNEFSEYASYFYALCAYKEGYKTLARDMFIQITRLYPNWSRTDEVYNWLSTIQFETLNPYQAIENSKKIKSAEISKQNEGIAQWHLSKIQSRDSLLDLYNVFPEYKPVASRLAEVESKRPYSVRDTALLIELAEKFPELDIKLEVPVESGKKDRYNVSVLLPFVMEQIQPDIKPKMNEFVLEFYRGVQLGLDSLEKSGSDIVDVHFFDTKRDTLTMRNLLNSKEIAQSDIIVGPVYNTQMVYEYGQRNQINVINPFSRNEKPVLENPYALLYSTPVTPVSYTAANFALEKIGAKKGIIFYADNSIDSLIAMQFADSVKKGGLTEIKSYRIKKDETRRILNILTGGSVVNKLDVVDNVSADSTIIFVSATQNAVTIYSNVISALEINGTNKFLIGSHNWIEDGHIGIAKFSSLGISLAATDFFNYTSSTFADFEKKFILKYSQPPGKFASIGYDFIFALNQLIGQHGKYFQFERSNGYVTAECPLSAPVDFSTKNFNTFVPIIQWDGTQFIIKNLD